MTFESAVRYAGDEAQLHTDTNSLNYQGGMMSSWNKFCYTGGYVEANVSLPGVNNVVGLWPAVWSMGNLGRAGYGASLDGLVRSTSTSFSLTL